METVDGDLEDLPLLDEPETESTRQFRCTECKKHFRDEKALISHMKLHNAQRSAKSGELYVCQQCGKTAKTRQALDRHAAYHQDERPYPCEKCHQRFKNSDDRGKHYRRLKRDNKFDHACTVCHKHFKSDELLRKHQVMLGCHSKTDLLEKKKTQRENNEFEEEEIMVEGEELTPVGDQNSDSLSDIKPLMCRCKMCESDFPSPESLKQHYRNHHNDCKRQVCIQCGQTLSSRDSLNRHYNIFHQDDFPYPCKQCDQKFKIKESLFRHIKFVHTDGGYMCVVCKHVFSQPVNLKKHMIVHSTKKDMICESCGKTFKWKQALEKHRLLSCDKPVNDLNKNCTKNDNETREDTETEENVKTSKYSFEPKGTEVKNFIQSEINVQCDKTVESFDAMDLILNSNDEAVPFRGQFDVHHDKKTFLKDKLAMETFNLNDEQIVTNVDHETDTHYLLSKENNITNKNIGLVNKNLSKNDKTISARLTVTNNDNIPSDKSSLQTNDEVCINSNLSITSNKVQSLISIEEKGCEIGVTDFNERGEILSFEGLRNCGKQQKDNAEDVHLDDLFLDKCCPTSKKNCDTDYSDHLNCSDDKGNEIEDDLTEEMFQDSCKKPSEYDPSDHVHCHDDKVVLTLDDSLKIRQTNERKIVSYQQRDSSAETKHTFRPSNLPLIMAPFGTPGQFEKQEKIKEIHVEKNKEMSNSIETKSHNQRIQKNPFIIQNVADQMDTESFSTQDTPNGDALDLSTTQTSKRSPTADEIPSGKFSLIKHMLSLQNEEHFDKSLFDNPLYNRPSRIHDFKKLAEMHKISNNVHVEEYDLSAKQNIPIHWLGLSRQNKVENHGSLMNVKQSCDTKATTSTSSTECFEKRVSKRSLKEERQINKIQKLDGWRADKKFEPKRKFAVNDFSFIDKVRSENGNSASSFDKNQYSFNDSEPKSRTNELQNDSDFIKSKSISSKVNVADNFFTKVNNSPEKPVGMPNSVFTLSEQHTLNTKSQKNVFTKKMINEDRYQTEHLNIFEASEESKHRESISNISVVGCKPSRGRNNHTLCRSNSEIFTSINERRNSSQSLSSKAYNPDNAYSQGLTGNTIVSGFLPTSLVSKLITCSSSVPATYTSHAMSRSISWPQPFIEDSLEVRKYDLKKNTFRDGIGRTVTQSQFGTEHLTNRKDGYIRQSDENSTDNSEVLLAESLDIIADSSRIQTSPQSQPLDITSIHSSHPVPYLKTNSQTYSSNQSPVCSKSGLKDMSFQSNHTAAQLNVVSSGFNSAIEMSNRSLSCYQSQFHRLNHNSKRQVIGFDGPRSERKAGIIAAGNDFNTVNPTAKTVTGPSEDRSLQNHESCNDLFKHNSNSFFPEKYFAWNNMPLGFSKNLFGNKRAMALKAQDELSVVDLLQLPSGTNKVKKHQNIEQFLKHCLD